MRVSPSNKTRSLNAPSALFANKARYLTDLINPACFFRVIETDEGRSVPVNSTTVYQPTRSRLDLWPVTPRSFVGKHCVATEGTCHRCAGTHPGKVAKSKNVYVILPSNDLIAFWHVGDLGGIPNFGPNRINKPSVGGGGGIAPKRGYMDTPDLIF